MCNNWRVMLLNKGDFLCFSYLVIFEAILGCNYGSNDQMCVNYHIIHFAITLRNDCNHKKGGQNFYFLSKNTRHLFFLPNSKRHEFQWNSVCNYHLLSVFDVQNIGQFWFTTEEFFNFIGICFSSLIILDAITKYSFKFSYLKL